MNTITEEISNPKFNVNEFVDKAIRDQQTRDEIIRLMMTNPDIMVYYHCYYVVSKASEARPELFYAYWPQMVSLLDHPNSYHRNIGLEVIANLAGVDDKDLFTLAFDRYFERIHDDKLLTCQYCLQGSKKIMQAKPALVKRILPLLLDLDEQLPFAEKQKEYLKGDLLDALGDHLQDVEFGTRIAAFIVSCRTSRSPKTAKKAKQMIAEFGIVSQ
jgi:hypothetical protein